MSDGITKQPSSISLLSQQTLPTDESVHDVREIFDMIDINKDGLIDSDELTAAMRSLGFEFSQKEIERFITELDPENTGRIDFSNFAGLIRSKMSERDRVEQIQMAFQMLDDDQTGKITFSNLKRIAKELGEDVTDQELHEMINEADTDHDGEVSFEEFVALVRTAAFA